MRERLAARGRPAARRRADWRIVDALIVEAHERAARAHGSRRATISATVPSSSTRPPVLLSSRAPRWRRPRRTTSAPALVAGSGELCSTLPELRTWWPRPDAVAPFVDEIAALRDSPIVLNRMQQDERLRAILARAARRSIRRQWWRAASTGPRTSSPRRAARLPRAPGARRRRRAPSGDRRGRRAVAARARAAGPGHDPRQRAVAPGGGTPGIAGPHPGRGAQRLQRHPVAGALQAELVHPPERLAAEMRRARSAATAELARPRRDLGIRHVDVEARLVGRALADEEIDAARMLRQLVGPGGVAGVEERPPPDLDPVAEAPSAPARDGPRTAVTDATPSVDRLPRLAARDTRPGTAAARLRFARRAPRTGTSRAARCPSGP